MPKPEANRSISTSIDLNLIQGIRLTHALAESEHPVFLPEAEVWKFQELQKLFPIKFTSDPAGAAILAPVKIGHAEIKYDLPDGPLLLWSSTRGRVFPIKAWDSEYLRVLLRSKFVLCPSGDYVWSYRVFESIPCDAIDCRTSVQGVPWILLHYDRPGIFSVQPRKHKWITNCARNELQFLAAN